MNAVALMVALAAAGVDYQVETTSDKQQQYTIQIEPELLLRVAGGEEIHSEVPADAGPLQRLCIRIGMTKPVHAPTSEAAFRQLLLSASRWAMADRTLTAADSPPTILWPARSTPEQSRNLRYGWQPDAEGKQSYYVQIDLAMLRSLAAGDEIYAPIDPAAGKLDRFIVTMTQKDYPPRIAGAAQAPAFVPTGPPFQTGGQTSINLLPTDNPRSQFQTPPATGGGFTPNNTALTPVEIPPAPGGPVAPRDYSWPMPRPNPQATMPLASVPPATVQPQPAPVVDNRPGAFSPPATNTYSTAPPNNYPANNMLEPPRSNFGGTASQQVADSRAYPGVTPNGTYGTNAAYGQQQGFGQPQGLSAADNRIAMQPPPVAATLPTVNPTGSLTSGAVPPALPAKEGWGIFIVVLFALFFSIGGNLYLAWTALEFHNRYRNAIDRLRSAARSS